MNDTEYPLLVVSVSGGQLTIPSIERLTQFVNGVAKGDKRARALVLESDDPEAEVTVTPLFSRAYSKLYRLRYATRPGANRREVVVAAASREEAWRFIVEHVNGGVEPIGPDASWLEELEDCDKGGVLVYLGDVDEYFTKRRKR